MTAAQATVTGIKVGSRWLRMSSEGRARGTSQCIGCGTQKKGSSKAGPACHRWDRPSMSPTGPLVCGVGDCGMFGVERWGARCRHLKASYASHHVSPRLIVGCSLRRRELRRLRREPWTCGMAAARPLGSEGQRGVLRLALSLSSLHSTRGTPCF